MKTFFSRPLYVFLTVFVLIALPLTTLPINLFDGEIVQQQGKTDVTIQAPLSLSYFLGFGYTEEDLMGIKDFYLLPKGYAVAVIVLFGIPGLVAYRVNLSKTTT
jgi:hypothetical protein